MVKIKNLTLCINDIPRLAAIWEDVLGRHWLPGTSAQKIERDLSHNLNKDKLPITLVAKQNNTPVGMISLCEKDGLESKLTPWLTDFVVDKSYQGKGIGNKLMKSALEKYTKLGYKKLYLFTFDKNLQSYYERWGWKKLSCDVYKTHPVIIMQIDLTKQLVFQ